MEFKHYSVTNNSEGSYCIAGLMRIDIPAKCVDHVIKLPAHSASTTVARLKQMYPNLDIKPVNAPVQAQPQTIAGAVEKASEKKPEKTDSTEKAKTSDKKGA